MSVVRLPIVPDAQRGECAEGGALYIRPCPFVHCRYHLAEECKPRGTPSTHERDESESCALDIASVGEQTGARVAELMGVSRSRIQQIEERALKKARKACNRLGVDLADILVRGRHPLDPGVAEEEAGRQAWSLRDLAKRLVRFERRYLRGRQIAARRRHRLGEVG